MFSHDGASLLAGNRLLAATQTSLTPVCDFPFDAASGAAAFRDAHVVAATEMTSSPGTSHRLAIFDVRLPPSTRPVWTAVADSGPQSSVGWNGDHVLVSLCSQEPVVSFWDLRNGGKAAFEKESESLVSLAADGRSVYVGDNAGRVWVYGAERGKGLGGGAHDAAEASRSPTGKRGASVAVSSTAADHRRAGGSSALSSGAAPPIAPETSKNVSVNFDTFSTVVNSTTGPSNSPEQLLIPQVMAQFQAVSAALGHLNDRLCRTEQRIRGIEQARAAAAAETRSDTTQRTQEAVLGVALGEDDIDWPEDSIYSKKNPCCVGGESPGGGSSMLVEGEDFGEILLHRSGLSSLAVATEAGSEITPTVFAGKPAKIVARCDEELMYHGGEHDGNNTKCTMHLEGAEEMYSSSGCPTPYKA